MKFKRIPKKDLKKAYDIKNKLVDQRSFQDFRENYIQVPDLFVGAYDHDKLIGIAFGKIEKGIVILRGIGVLTRSSNKGVGSKLLSFFEKQVKKKGIKVVSVGSAAYNPKTKKNTETFYIRNGYKPVELFIEKKGKTTKRSFEKYDPELPAKLKKKLKVDYVGYIMDKKLKMSKESLRKRAKKASKFRSKTLVAVVENPKLIQNLMGIVRTAEALGVGKLFVIDNGRLHLPEDWQEMRDNPHLKNRSASGIKWIFVKVFSSTSECLEHLAKKNYTNVGTSPHKLCKKNIVLSKGDYTQKHLAIWFGNETKGLSEEALKACEFCVKIPMYGIIESMNLSSSASVVLNHIVEKRQEYSKKKLAKRASKKK